VNRKSLTWSTILCLFAPPTFALEITQTTDPNSVKGDYPYNILDLRPGDSKDRLMEVAQEKNIAVEVNAGTFTLEGGGKSIGINLEYGFSTIGYENHYTYQYDPSWDILGGSFTSPATSSVVGSLGRQLAIPRADAPSYEAFKLQLVERYGEPSWEGNSILGQSMWWVEDVQGNLVSYDAEPGTSDEEPCALHSGQPDYVELEIRNQPLGCSVHYSATYQINQQNINLRFTLSDDALIFEDRRSFSDQIDAEIGGTQEASDLDL